MQGGSSVVARAYADDVAITAASPGGAQRILTSLGEYLAYHGVSISETKTHYISRSKRDRVTVDQFCRSSTPGSPHMCSRTFVSEGPDAVLEYLGGHVSLSLHWPDLNKATAVAVNLEFYLLSRRALSFEETVAYVRSVLFGKLNFYLQVGQFSTTQLEKWDVRLNRILRRRAGMSWHSTTDGLHAPRSHLGLGIFSVSTLAAAACGTELLSRLNSPGTVGDAARGRWHALCEYS
jgi:hypothetical protein